MYAIRDRELVLTRCLSSRHLCVLLKLERGVDVRGHRLEAPNDRVLLGIARMTACEADPVILLLGIQDEGAWNHLLGRRFTTAGASSSRR